MDHQTSEVEIKPINGNRVNDTSLIELPAAEVLPELPPPGDNNKMTTEGHLIPPTNIGADAPGVGPVPEIKENEPKEFSVNAIRERLRTEASFKTEKVPVDLSARKPVVQPEPQQPSADEVKTAAVKASLDTAPNPWARFRNLVKKIDTPNIIPPPKQEIINLGPDSDIKDELVAKLMSKPGLTISKEDIDQALDEEDRLTGGDPDRRYRMFRALEQETQHLVPLYKAANTFYGEIQRKITEGTLQFADIDQYVENTMIVYFDDNNQTMSEEDMAIIKKQVQMQLAIENTASDIAKEIESSIVDSHRTDESVQKLVQDYMEKHSDIAGNRERIQQRATERVLNKLAVQRIQNTTKPNIISVEKLPPVIIPPTVKQSEVQIPVEDTRSGEISSIERQQPQVTIETVNAQEQTSHTMLRTEATKTIMERLNTKGTSASETEEQRIQGSINEYVGQSTGVGDEDKRAVEAEVKKHIDVQNRTEQAARQIAEIAAQYITSADRHNDQLIRHQVETNLRAYLENHPAAVDLNPAQVIQQAMDRVANRLTVQALDPNASPAQQTASAPAPEAPKPPEEPNNEQPKNPVLPDQLVRTSDSYAQQVQMEIQNGGENVDEIIKRKLDMYQQVHGSLEPAQLAQFRQAIKDRLQKRMSQPAPQKKEGLLRTYWRILTGK